jgi:hypothetical protein
MRVGRSTTLAYSVALAAGLVWAVGGNAGEHPKKLRIIYTNDTQGMIEPCG